MLTATGQNAMLTGGLGNAITHVSLHTGNPGSTGTNEATGGSPAYARKAVTWAAASAGTRANGTSSLVFDVAAGSTILFAGYWDAISAGNFYGYSGIGASLLGGNGAAATSDLITSYAHGLVANDRVFFQDVSEALPTGIAEGTVYYVISTGLTTDVFSVSTTLGGGALDITGAGDVRWEQTKPETFGSQGTLTMAIGAIVLDATLSGTA